MDEKEKESLGRFLKATTATSLGQFLRWNAVLICILIGMCVFFILTDSGALGAALGVLGFFVWMLYFPQSATFWYCGKAFRANIALLGGYMALRAVVVQIFFAPLSDHALPFGLSHAHLMIGAEIVVALLVLLGMVKFIMPEVRRPASYWQSS